MWGKAVIIAIGWLIAVSLVIVSFHHLVRRNKERRERRDRRHAEDRRTTEDRRKQGP